MTDTSTGLVWQRDGLGSRDCLLSPYCTETEAVAYCAGLSLDGSGWRLPTYTELNSILDTTVAYPPLINKAAFPNTPAEDFLTSSLPCSGNCGTSYYIDVNFSAGDNTADYNGNADCRVRCVRDSGAKTCSSPGGGGTCADDGYLYCGSACCPSSYPYYCSTTGVCYSTSYEAMRACGSTVCSHCGT